MRGLICGLIWLLSASACLVEHGSRLPEDFSTCISNESPLAPGSEILTYYEHAKPIIDAKCVGCHVEGGIAPFSLAGFDTAFLFRTSIGLAIESDVMPPWHADSCCSDYRWDRRLTASEKQTLLTWLAQGPRIGDPDLEAAPLEYDRGGMERIDATIRMPEPYDPVPVQGDDDFRCFVLDWPFEDKTYVTGINVRPGNPSVVHHVIAYVISDSAAEKLQEREGQDGRPGYQCFGELGTLPESAIGGWQPGFLGLSFPAGTGRKVDKGSKILLNVHYDLANRTPEPDQMEIDVSVTSSVAREVKGVGVANPMWLVGDALRIDAGDSDAMYNFAFDPTVIFGRGDAFEVFSANLHMHELGSSGSIAVIRADGSVECILNITDFDYHWNGEYTLEEPVVIYPGDELYVECHFDNSAENQKVIDGERPPPKDISWGPNEEMCAGLLLMTEVQE